MTPRTELGYDDAMWDDLVILERVLVTLKGCDDFGNGYGTQFENDVFMMHNYCWCERSECPWCGPEERANFIHKPSGVSVWWYKYMGRGGEVAATTGRYATLGTIMRDCYASLAGFKR